MDDIFEAIIEFFGEIYIDLIAALLPEKKLGKKTLAFVKAVCALLGIGVMILIVGGIVLIIPGVNRNLTAGISMLSVGGAIFLSHVIIFTVKLLKEKKAKSLTSLTTEETEETKEENTKDLKF